jgi:hypothetical protein
MSNDALSHASNAARGPGGARPVFMMFAMMITTRGRDGSG